MFRLHVLLSCALAAGCSDPRDPAPRGEPNVLLISIDTLRADGLGCYGYERATSPAIDALARRSIVFEDAHATASWTLPSMISVMTSLYPAAHGSRDMRTPLGLGPPTLAERLGEAGYLTGAVVSQAFCSRRFGMERGFHYFDDSIADSGRANEVLSKSSAEVNARAEKWLAARASSSSTRPWFLWLHYFDPHMAYVPHAGVTELFGTSERDRYDGEIAWTDRHVGEVLGWLEEYDFAGNTIVVLLSDHGEEFGEHGARYHGHTLYAEVVRIPLILHLPGDTPRRSRELASLVDVTPTILAHALGEAVDEIQGVALAADADRAAVLAELTRPDGIELSARITRDSKLIEEGESGLYFDRTNDPGERDALPVPEGELELLREELHRAEQLSDLIEEHPAIELSPRERDALRALGYTDD